MSSKWFVCCLPYFLWQSWKRGIPITVYSMLVVYAPHKSVGSCVCNSSYTPWWILFISIHTDQHGMEMMGFCDVASFTWVCHGEGGGGGGTTVNTKLKVLDYVFQSWTLYDLCSPYDQGMHIRKQCIITLLEILKSGTLFWIHSHLDNMESTMFRLWTYN